MSSEYNGVFNEIKLNEWNAGLQRAFRAIDTGDTRGALYEARAVVDSYLKHRQGTDTWDKITLIAALIFVAFIVVSGVATGNWIGSIILGMIGLVPVGFLRTKVVDKRMALDNDFYDNYERLADAIAQLSEER